MCDPLRHSPLRGSLKRAAICAFVAAVAFGLLVADTRINGVPSPPARAASPPVWMSK